MTAIVTRPRGSPIWEPFAIDSLNVYDRLNFKAVSKFARAVRGKREVGIVLPDGSVYIVSHDPPVKS